MRSKPIVYMAGCLDEAADHTMIFIIGQQLQALGYATIDEYDLPREKGLTPKELRRFSNAALISCNLVCFVDGWEKNPTAVLERALCHRWGKLAVSSRDLIRNNEQMQDIEEEHDGKTNRRGQAEAGVSSED